MQLTIRGQDLSYPGLVDFLCIRLSSNMSGLIFQKESRLAAGGKGNVGLQATEPCLREMLNEVLATG